MTYEYSATVVRVIDGDTAILKLEKEYTLDIDFGFFIKDKMSLVKTTEINFRLKGIDTPEIQKPTYNEGIVSKNELIRLLSLGSITVVSSKPDKYGRWLAVLFVTLPDGIKLNINDELIKNGFAVPYMA